MEYIIIYKSEKLDLTSCSNVGMIIDHYRFLSESLARRIDQKLNEILPKMFYEVEPVKEEARAGIEIRVLGDHVNNIIEEFLTPSRGLLTITGFYPKVCRDELTKS